MLASSLLVTAASASSTSAAAESPWLTAGLSWSYILTVLVLSVVSYFGFQIAYNLFLKPFLYWLHYWRQGVPCLPFVPLMGNLTALTRHQNSENKSLFTTGNCIKFNSLFFIHFIGPVCRLSVSDPVAFNSIMHRENQTIFTKSSVGAKAFGPVLGSYGLVMLQNGEPHDWHRRMIAPAFRTENLKSMVDLVFEVTAKNVARFPELHEKPAKRITAEVEKAGGIGSNNSLVDLHEHFSTMALDIVTTCVFGESVYRTAHGKESDTGKILYETFTTTLEQSVSYFLSLAYLIRPLRFLKYKQKSEIDSANRRIDLLSNKLLEDRIAGKSKAICKGKDLLDILIAAEDENGKKFTPQEILDECRVFIFAGHETTANLLTWTMYALSENPKVLEKLLKEIDGFYSRHSRIDTENLNEFEYLGAVLNESLRLYPPVPVLNREAAVDALLPTRSGGSIFVKQGTIIMPNIHYIHRNKLDWGEDAEDFKPERWLKIPAAATAIDDAQKRRAAAFVPFNLGARNCIGQHFAMQEAKIVAAHFLRCFDFRVVENKVFPVTRITMRPRYGLTALVTPRAIATQQLSQSQN